MNKLSPEIQLVNASVATSTAESLSPSVPRDTALSTYKSGSQSSNTTFQYPQASVSHTDMILLWLVGGLILLAGLFCARPWLRRVPLPDDRKKNNVVAQKVAGMVMVFVALGIFVGAAFLERTDRDLLPVVFSKRDMMDGLWANYKTRYVEASTGRTVDLQQHNITTSEGESYTMLRAVWIDDREVFDKSWQWTKQYLERPDHLFSWLYSRLPDGNYGVSGTLGSYNAASDADSDIALSLIFAYARWGDVSYLTEAQHIIHAIWQKEVLIINQVPYLASDDTQKRLGGTVALLNPSYFAPYAYRIFATIDPNDGWNELVNSSYNVIEKSMQLPLDKESSAGLPPNWVVIDRTTGELQPATTILDTNYGFDALRIPFRLALDWEWFHDARAKATLDKLSFFATQWKSQKVLQTEYAHNGTPVYTAESPAFYGGAVGYFKISDPRDFNTIYKNKLEILYGPDGGGWREPMSYYDDNWAWFGIALANDYLPNIFEAINHPVARQSS